MEELRPQSPYGVLTAVSSRGTLSEGASEESRENSPPTLLSVSTQRLIGEKSRKEPRAKGQGRLPGGIMEPEFGFED